MSLEYKVVEVYTREGARLHHLALHDAIVKAVHDRKVAARVLVFKTIGGAFESGEMVSQHLLDVSYDLPVKIEIILPAAELDLLLPVLEEMVHDGVMAVKDLPVVLHRTEGRLLPRHLQVRDVMTPGPQVVRPETTVHDVVHLLAEHDFNAVPVIADDKVVGIITQGDLLTRAGLPLRLGLFAEYDRLEREKQLPSGPHTAREIMSTPVVSVQAEESLERAARLMVDKDLKRLPVVDSEERLVGVLARIDVLQAMQHHAPGRHEIGPQDIAVEGSLLVGDTMLHEAPAVGPETRLSEALDLFGPDTQRVAVVDGTGTLVGLLSDRDLLAVLPGRHEGLLDHLRLSLAGKRRRHDSEETLEQLKARDVMTTELATVREGEPLENALALMTGMRLKRLPVLGADGTFRGFLSRDAVVRAGLAGGQSRSMDLRETEAKS